MKINLVLILFLGMFFISCQSVRFIKNEQNVSKKFLNHIRNAKALSNSGKMEEAWTKLGELNNWSLNNIENALADNLRGSILFKLKNFDKSMKYFSRAWEEAPANSEIKAQVGLNMSNLYYSQKEYDDSWRVLSKVKEDHLYISERKSYYALRYKIANQKKLSKEAVLSLLYYLEDYQSYDDIQKNTASDHLVIAFSELSQVEQKQVLNSIESKNFAEVLLIQKYLNEFLYTTEEGEVDEYLLRMEKYSLDPLVRNIYADFLEMKKGGGKLNSGAIGVIVPLTGKMARFGRSVLKGIDLALFDIYGENKPRVFVRDSHGNAMASRLAVQDLVEKHHVAYIVGGVFSKTASEEFLEAKKYGTLFFSLSPIYLSFAEKNSMLFEVFGSIESQISELLSEKNLQKNGRNFVMVYPRSDAGRNYYKEVLRQSAYKNVNLINAISFSPGLNNYQETIKKLLGIGYVKKYLDEIDESSRENLGLPKKREFTYVPVMEVDGQGSNLSSKSKGKKLELDFKWAYVPALPGDALQIIPNFRYFEARGLHYYGVPSWKTKTFLNRHIGLGHLFFISAQESILQKRFSKIYKDRFHKKAGIVESMAYESISLGKRILDQNIGLRSELIKYVNSLQILEGFSSSWHKQDGIWFKDMSTYQIDNRKVRKVD